MSDLKTKIDHVLTERAKNSAKILAQFKNAHTLIEYLDNLIGKIRSANIEEYSQFVPELEEKKNVLEESLNKYSFLEKRVKRTDKIYIGLAGSSQCGKSSLIRTLTNLPKSIIPSADKGSSQPTTAVHSDIFNHHEKKAVIYFYNPQEFKDSLAKLLVLFGKTELAYNLDKFQSFDFDTLEASASMYNNIQKLKRIQKSYPYFKDKLTGGSETLTEDKFSEGRNYVTYMNNDDVHRYWPAVKEVKVYAPFEGIASDAQIALLDLPGFDESGYVTETTLEKLKDVDFLFFIENPAFGKSSFQEPFWKSYDSIKNRSMLRSTFHNFLSVFINVFIGNTDENRCNDAINNFKGKSKLQHEIYKASVELENGTHNTAKVAEIFGKAAEKLAATLSEMDDELNGDLQKDFNIDAIKSLLEKLSTFVNQYSYQNDDPAKFHTKGRIFRRDFDKDLENLLAKYENDSEDIDNGFCSKVAAIADQTDNDIADNLLYKPSTERPTWDIYIDKSAEGSKALSTFAAELRRVWVETLIRYINLDDDFTLHIGKLKKEILDLFDSRSHIVPKTENGEYDLPALLEKLQCLGDDNELTLAFTSLQTLAQNFRQNLYPYIFRDHLEKGMLVEGEGGVRKLDTTQDLRIIENYKRQLVPMCQNNNYEISKNIQQNFVLSYFLIGALHTFRESITYAKTDYDADFVKFCSIFRKNIYPEEFGDAADSVKVEELKTLLEQTKELITKIQ